MTNEERDLQDPGTWDFSNAVVNPGTQKARAVVSVAFARADYLQVVQAAEKSSMKTSEFIRSAALTKAKSLTTMTSFGSASLSQAGFVIAAGSFVPGTSTSPLQNEVTWEELTPQPTP